MPKPLSEWIHLLLPEDQAHTNFLFRVDAGRVWGLSFGHLARCLILAHRLQKSYKAETLFLMRNYPEGVKYAQHAGQKVVVMPVELSRKQETEMILNSIEEFNANVLIVDLPYQDIDISYFTYLKNKAKKIVFIDDCRYISPDADLILNSSILAVEKTRQVKNICYLLGPEYFIIEEVQQQRISRSNPFVHIIMTFGGSDPAGLTLKAVQALAEVHWAETEFRIILGPGYTDTEDVKSLVQKNGNHIQVICNPSNIYPFFLDCDLAICAGGRTLYELYTFHVPTFAIASIDHEIPVIQAFLKQNLLIAGLKSWNEQEFMRLFDRSLTIIKKRKQLAGSTLHVAFNT